MRHKYGFSHSCVLVPYLGSGSGSFPAIQQLNKPPCATGVGEKGRAIEDVLRRAKDIVTLGKTERKECETILPLL